MAHSSGVDAVAPGIDEMRSRVDPVFLLRVQGCLGFGSDCDAGVEAVYLMSSLVGLNRPGATFGPMHLVRLCRAYRKAGDVTLDLECGANLVQDLVDKNEGSVPAPAVVVPPPVPGAAAPAAVPGGGVIPADSDGGSDGDDAGVPLMTPATVDPAAVFGFQLASFGKYCPSDASSLGVLIHGMLDLEEDCMRTLALSRLAVADPSASGTSGPAPPRLEDIIDKLADALQGRDQSSVARALLKLHARA